MYRVLHRINALYTMNIPPTSSQLIGRYAGVYCFGPGKGRHDWSLNNLQTSKDVVDKLACFELFCRLKNIARTAGPKPIRTIFSPRLDGMHANLVGPEDFKSGVTHTGHHLTLFRKASGSGMEIPPDTAVFFPTGDCPTVIIRSPVTFRMFAAHAGLRELIDFSRLTTGTPSRRNHSIVETIIDQFPADEISQLQVTIVCGIGPTCYTHPVDHREYGELNRKIIAHIQSLRMGKHCVHNAESAGRINLAALIASQAVAKGIPASTIFTDQSDTYTDMTGGGGTETYKWWSYRRARDTENTADMPKRNGVLVTNPT